MADVTVTVSSEATPRVIRLRLEDGSGFLVLKFGGECSVIAPGRDEDAIKWARAIEVACGTAAALLEAENAAKAADAG